MTAQYESIKRKVEISIHTNARWWHSSIQDLPDIIPISIHTTVRWWLINRRWPCAYSNFNPHHRKVVTFLILLYILCLVISIHTTARWWLQICTKIFFTRNDLLCFLYQKCIILHTNNYLKYIPRNILIFLLVRISHTFMFTSGSHPYSSKKLMHPQP